MNFNLVFLIFSFFLLFSALMVILLKHPIFSLLFLVSCFIFSSFLLFMLECEFLAFLFIIVYVGAIAILFLFAIMMLESKEVDLSKNVLKYIPIGFVFSFLFVFPLIKTVSVTFESDHSISMITDLKYLNWYDLIDSIRDVEVYGQILYSYFVLDFLLAGFILLLVLVGVVYLTNNNLNTNKILKQSLFKQLSRNSEFFFKN